MMARHRCHLLSFQALNPEVSDRRIAPHPMLRFVARHRPSIFGSRFSSGRRKQATFGSLPARAAIAAVTRRLREGPWRPPSASLSALAFFVGPRGAVNRSGRARRRRRTDPCAPCRRHRDLPGSAPRDPRPLGGRRRSTGRGRGSHRLRSNTMAVRAGPRGRGRSWAPDPRAPKLPGRGHRGVRFQTASTHQLAPDRQEFGALRRTTGRWTMAGRLPRRRTRRPDGSTACRHPGYPGPSGLAHPGVGPYYLPTGRSNMFPPRGRIAA
jgi:hypothetical protein